MTRDVMFISREQVLAIVSRLGTAEAKMEIEKLWAFPAPNPQGLDGRNIMGQTEEEFWDAVDRKCAT